MLKGIPAFMDADLMWVLAAMGHGDDLVICDTNFPADSVARHTITGELLRMDNLEFLITYTVVGAVFAGLIFVASAISIPMILDRQSDAISSALTSFRACLQNPGVMFLWGALITTSVVLAMLPAFLGLLVVGPVMGHATWHAYRAIVPRV